MNRMDQGRFQEQVLDRLDRIETRLLHEDTGLFSRVGELRSDLALHMQNDEAELETLNTKIEVVEQNTKTTQKRFWVLLSGIILTVLGAGLRLLADLV